MKKFYVFFIILLSIAVFAQETYNQGSSTTVSGHKVIVVNIGQMNVVVSVDGVKDIVPLYGNKDISGVKISVVEIFYTGEVESRSTKLLLEALTTVEGVAFGECGDGNCDGTETKENCCADCGCEKNYSCVDSKCMLNECSDSEECWNIPNRDFCISYKCEGKPKKCTQTPITECVVNDKCCPSNCYYPDDSDCDASKLNPNPSEQVQKQATNTSEVTEIKEVKEGFFRRLLNWILGWFR
ncbi:MAG: hypothetical protein AB1571_00700 [Nanoarchaeota archaeon]